MTRELTTDDTAAMRRDGTWRAYLRGEMNRGPSRAATPAQRPPAATLRSAVDVPCAHCQAPAGRPCTTRSGRHGVARPHDTRQAAYAAALTTQEQTA